MDEVSQEKDSAYKYNGKGRLEKQERIILGKGSQESWKKENMRGGGSWENKKW